MKYRATCSIDFTKQNTNEYQKLVAALMGIGWKRQETSAFTWEGDLVGVWGAVDLIARQAEAAGVLSALAVSVLGSDSDFAGTAYPAARNHPNAVQDIQSKRFPKYP